MSIVTLATSISKQAHPFYTTWSYDSPGNRLAVPLTTVWSFPTDCTTDDYLRAVGTGTCSPPYFDGVYSYHGYYSPGVCYLGYTIGCIATGTNVNLEPVKPLETVAFCVPRNYGCEIIYDKNGYSIIRYARPTVTGVVLAPALQIRWQSSDSTALGSLYVPSSVVASILQRQTSTLAIEATGLTPPATSTIGTRETIGAQEITGSSNSGLSSGQIAAIVICAAIVPLGTLLATFILFRLKRKQRGAASQSLTATNGPGGPPDGNTLELPSTPRQEKAELPAVQVVSAIELANEVPVQRTPELSGSLAPARTELLCDQEVQAYLGQTSSATGVVTMSAPSPAWQQSTNPANQAAEDLIAQSEVLEEKRRRLLELMRIDEEQERIRQRLSVVRQEEQHIQRHEMP